jgi:hypothetical protein
MNSKYFLSLSRILLFIYYYFSFFVGSSFLASIIGPFFFFLVSIIGTIFLFVGKYYQDLVNMHPEIPQKNT